MSIPGRFKQIVTRPWDITAIPGQLLMGLIRLYRLILSPWLGNQCRFYPSCSHYAEEAIQRHGAITGCVLTIRRLGKCHPWHEGGCDPVPSHRS